MGAYQAKDSLINICACTGSGDYEEVKKILDRNPSLINQVTRIQQQAAL